MTCITQTCQPGRAECKTPWTCHGYESEAHYAAMNAPLQITMESDEAADKRHADDPLELMTRIERIALCVLPVLALLAALLLWNYGPGWAQWLTWLSFR